MWLSVREPIGAGVGRITICSVIARHDFGFTVILMSESDVETIIHKRIRIVIFIRIRSIKS